MDIEKKQWLVDEARRLHMLEQYELPSEKYLHKHKQKKKKTFDEIHGQLQELENQSKSILGIEVTEEDKEPEQAIQFYNRLKKNKLVVVPRKEDVGDAVELEQPHLQLITESLNYKDSNQKEDTIGKPSRNIIDLYIHC